MKLRLPKLHNQIVIGLIFGAIFGSLFKVHTNRLEIKLLENNSEKFFVVENWEKFVFIVENDSVSFNSNQQLEIISYFNKIKEKKPSIVIHNFYNDNNFIYKKYLESIISINKEKTIAQSIKWIGEIFIKLLNMIAVPLVLASLIVGAASLGDIKKFARIGAKTLLLYVTTSAIAITLGLIVANVIRPGEIMNIQTKERLSSIYDTDIKSKIQTELDFSISKMLVDIVPRNPFYAIVNSEMLQIVFFAVMFGMVLTIIKKEKAEPVINFFDGLSEVMIKFVDVVMILAPIGVFALIAATVSEFGFDILQTLIWYSLTVLIGLLIHGFGVYSLILKSFSKINLKEFFKSMKRVQIVAFTTSSSAATLPVNIEVCQNNLRISKSITSFVLPLGATINMDGTALYQGVASVFIAQVFGMDLNIIQQLTIVLTAILASIGTAPVPGVGIIMLIVILKSVGIPEEGIALIMGVDRILDMCRTVINVTGDAVVTSVVASSENEINIY
ncbi:dicarboxylate/amino acid:cation symporter [Ignavibacteria bacterium 4148-Me]|uniref:dicarboxylate/amino acid:cation symporter n=1 Tax=Rosettibacter primus TaxID=3111523 RepID=UPI00336C2104